MSLKGGKQLRARLKAVRKDVGQPMSKAWAKECTGLIDAKVGAMSLPYSGKSGGQYGSRSHPKYRMQRSFRVKAGRMKSGLVGHYTVVGSFHAWFVNAGVKPHTVFGRRHPGYRARPFRAEAAREAYRRQVNVDPIYAAWNAAA